MHNNRLNICLATRSHIVTDKYNHVYACPATGLWNFTMLCNSHLISPCYGFQQVIEYPTHSLGWLIDHAYINNTVKLLEIIQMCPYYSDHDALLLSLDTKK